VIFIKGAHNLTSIEGSLKTTRLTINVPNLQHVYSRKLGWSNKPCNLHFLFKPGKPFISQSYCHRF